MWFPSFRKGEMMPRAVSVLRQFPFSAVREGITYSSVHCGVVRAHGVGAPIHAGHLARGGVISFLAASAPTYGPFESAS